MNAHVFLAALATVLGVAAVTTVVFQRLKQPVVLGYILAGLIVGPYLPIPLVADRDVVHTLSELGVILLMFSLGLEFSLRKLAEVGPTAGLTAVIQCGLMGWLGYLVGQGLGWTDMESLFVGAALAVSSTTIIAKVFDEQKVGGRLRDLVVGILIVEDLISVLVMAALTAVSKDGSLSTGTLVKAGGQLAVFLVLMMLLGLLVIPRAMRMVTRLGVNETTVVASVGFCFVGALAAMEAGYSVALGAFLAGSLVSESGQGKQVEHLLLPVRDMFAAIFFVSVGMLLDPAQVAEHWGAVLLFTGLVLVGKILSVTVGAVLTGNGLRTSTQAGMSLAQIGEFSFIIAALGLSLKVTGDFLYPIVVAVSVLTTLTTPWLIRFSGPSAEWVDRKLPKRLQTFSALYANWAERLARNPRKAELRARVWSLAKLLLLDAAAVVLVVVMSRAYATEITAWLEGAMGSKLPGRLVVLGLALLAALPFFAGIVRVTRALGNLLADAVFPAQDAQHLDLAAAPRRAMVAAVQWVVTLLLGLPLLALTQPLLKGWQGGALFTLLLLALALGFWRHATNLQGHVRAGSELLAETLKARLMKGQAQEAEEELSYQPGFLSGMGDPVTVQVAPGSPCVGRSLAGLNLRGATGATVLVLVRVDGRAGTPLPNEALAEGDTLVLAGTAPAVEAAKRLLNG